jgi:hypothetical protein
MAVITFDRKLIVFQTMGFNIDARNKSGGITLQNREQIAFGGNSLWKMHGIARIRTPAQVREWRRILWLMKGRLNSLLIGPCDCKNSGYIPPVQLVGIPHDDGTPFDDSTGYSQGGVNSSVVEDAPVGTNIVKIYKLSAQNVLAGTYIGFGDKLYGITDVAQTGIYLTLTLEPRLRETVTTATIVRYCDARAPMRFTEDTMGFLDLFLGRFGDIDIEMIEFVGG